MSVCVCVLLCLEFMIAAYLIGNRYHRSQQMYLSNTWSIYHFGSLNTRRHNFSHSRALPMCVLYVCISYYACNIFTYLPVSKLGWKPESRLSVTAGHRTPDIITVTHEWTWTHAVRSWRFKKTALARTHVWLVLCNAITVRYSEKSKVRTFKWRPE